MTDQPVGSVGYNPTGKVPEAADDVVDDDDNVKNNSSTNKNKNKNGDRT